MIPQANHPLTLAYVASVRAPTHDSMVRALALVRNLETDQTPVLIAQCKLAAEVLIERKLV